MIFQTKTKSQKLQNNYRKILNTIKQFKKLDFKTIANLDTTLNSSIGLVDEMLYYTDTKFKVNDTSLTVYVQTIYNKLESVKDGLTEEGVSFENDLTPLLISILESINVLEDLFEEKLANPLKEEKKEEKSKSKSMSLEEFANYYKKVTEENEKVNQNIENIQQSGSIDNDLKDKFDKYQEIILPKHKDLKDRNYLVIDLPILLMSVSGIRQSDLKKLKDVDYVNLTPGVIFENQQVLAVPSDTNLESVLNYLEEVSNTQGTTFKPLFAKHPKLTSIRSNLAFYWVTPLDIYTIVKEYRLITLKFGFTEEYSKEELSIINKAKEDYRISLETYKLDYQNLNQDNQAKLKELEDSLDKKEKGLLDNVSGPKDLKKEITSISKEIKSLKTCIKLENSKYKEKQQELHQLFIKTVNQIKN